MRRLIATASLVLPLALVAVPTPASAGDHPVLMYLPNRIFDIFDIVRVRCRIGPGLAVGARVTKLTDVFAGGYATVWAGMPGPRGKPRIALPVGIEAKAGAGVSLAQATAGGPYYGVAEVGAGFQLLLFGFDFGVAPWDFVDLLAGFIFLDPVGDDF
jgi:hypothetical protein